MSFPTLPDIDPAIDIDLCDAIHLLLSSIAMEEISLSKLIAAEHETIQYALACGHDDILRINKSADAMLKTIIKLQMLLQFKLENVRELQPCCVTASTSTTTTSTTCTFSTTTQACHGCCLTGTGRGCIDRCQDRFGGQPASLYAFIPCCGGENRTIRFVIGAPCERLYLYACDDTVEVCCEEDRLVACGRGRLRYDGEQEAMADFTLTVRAACQGDLAFRVSVESECLSYDSGFITVNCDASDLRMGVCP